VNVIQSLRKRDGRPEPGPRLSYQARPVLCRSQTRRIRVGQAGSYQTHARRNWIGADSIQSVPDRTSPDWMERKSTRGVPGPEPTPRLSYQAWPGQSWSRKGRLRVRRNGVINPHA
jgi:hypothetical protein